MMILRSSLYVISLLMVAPVSAFFVPTGHRTRHPSNLSPMRDSVSSSETASSMTTTEADSSSNPMHLTPELLKIANAFEAIGDDKLRYKQLLYMANQLAPIDPSKQIPENKVPGCLSTVYIDGKVTDDSTKDDVRIEFEGDSDGLLTKGLVALLIRGLSGNTAADIQQVDPAFIKKAGIAASLTPGRNNGFLNMLAVIKKKALQIEADYKEEKTTTTTAAAAAAAAASDGDDVNNSTDDRPMYNKIMQTLQALQPVSMELHDVSYQHAGHAQNTGDGVESHFELNIVAEAFEGLNLVKRHQLIYMLLGEVMPKIHALQISAKTPAEVNK